MASPQFQEVLATLRKGRTPEHRIFELQLMRSWMATGSAPPDARLIPARAGGVPAEWVCAPQADGGRRLLYLHGGGYVAGCAAWRRPLAAGLSRVSGCAVLLADYRLAPEHPCPAAVEDAAAAFRWMLENGPDGRGRAARTFIAGDSAGGGLTLAALQALRDAGGPLPDAAVAISAYADLAHTGESVRSQAAADPVMCTEWLPHFAGAYLGGQDARTPAASPLYGDFSGLPPLLLHVGEAEIIRDDTVRCAEKARKQGVRVELEVWPEMIHVWHDHAGKFPEAGQALERIGSFLRDF